MGKWVIGNFRALQVMLGQVGTEGLGFSMDAVPLWIASAPFQEDKTGGTEVCQDYLVGYLILWLECSI